MHVQKNRQPHILFEYTAAHFLCFCPESLSHSLICSIFPDVFADFQHHGRSYGKFIYSHLHKCICQLQICAKFSADTGPFSTFVCIFHNHTDHAQNRFVMRVVKIIQFCILTVNRQCILCQVIGSNT